MRSKKIMDRKAYHRIPHLRGSHLETGDYYIPEGQQRICTEKTRDKLDKIFVQEKLDGSSVAVVRIDGNLIPVLRSGWGASDAKYRQHHMFARWFYKNYDKFIFLEENQRVCGEWLAQAHGTKYVLAHEPFVAFDILGPGGAKNYDALEEILPDWFPRPRLLHSGGPCPIEHALELLGELGHHGAIESAEGCVWRVERDGKPEFMAKFVRPQKRVGCYLENDAEIWNENLDKYL